MTTDGTIVYHYEQTGLLISETQADGTPIRDYLWQDGRLVAQIDNHGVSEQISYLHTDHLATPRLATDENKNIVWKWEGEAFGKEAAESLGATVNIRFPGQYFDVETGLVYNWNRYYDPQIGRYITSDPIGLDGGINTYGYVGGNPLSFIDPFGLVNFNPNTPGFGGSGPGIGAWGGARGGGGRGVGPRARAAPEVGKFKRWKRGDAIDKPLKDGSKPSFDVVRDRYWKNRYEASKNSGEFSKRQLDRMRRG